MRSVDWQQTRWLVALMLCAACQSDPAADAPTAGTSPAAAAGTSAPPATSKPPSAAGSGGASSTTTTTTTKPGATTPPVPSSTSGAAGATTPAPTAAAGSSSPAAAGGSAPAPTAGTAAPAPTNTKPAVFWLDILANTVWRANVDGSEAVAVVKNNNISAPDGVSVDLEGGHIYWTNMGTATGGGNKGTVQRATLDGKTVETIVPAGVGNTFKQLTIDHTHKKLYWCDREGAKVWRANFDGSEHEVLASGHDFNQLVGIALDVAREQFYFTDRNAKKIMRAAFAMPAGQTDANRSDIEVLLSFGGSSMPIDLDVDLDQRMIYWTDRGLGTVVRAPMDLKAGDTADKRTDAVTLISDVGEPIGISLDHENSMLYFGNVGGQLFSAKLDGTDRKMIGKSSSVTGVSLVHVPAP
jgi:sugar lactone lactonase YvrE